MAGLTLVEAAKIAGQNGDVVRSAIIEEIARASGVLELLPFENIAGNALKYNREETLPGVAFRGVNESYTPSTGVLNPQTESLFISGGELDVDNFIIETMGNGARASQSLMKVKAVGKNWDRVFFKGDNVSDPREPDGLQNRLTGSQLIEGKDTPTSGGDVLTLAKMDELIDAVDNPSALFMNKTMRRLLTAAARTSSVHAGVQYTVDSFGRAVTTYNGIPIRTIDQDNTGAQILPFTEVGGGGGTAQCTSIYCVSFGSADLTGIQSSGIQVRDLGELETKPARRTRVEWYSGLAVFHSKAAARLRGIKAGAVTA